MCVGILGLRTKTFICRVAVAPYMAKMSSVYAVPLGVSMYIYYLVAF